VTVKYRINGGPVQSAPMSEWQGGQRYSPASVYYHQMRGVVTGTDPGDSVEVWFEGGGQRSDSFTYQAVSESGNRVLVVAAEDYTGASPVQSPGGPHYANTYVDALAANGQQADVYDIDAAGRLAPDALGVLSHYDAVVWETGDDLVTRTAGRAGGNADRLALDEILEFRSYMNEGGKVMLAGDSAGQQYAQAAVGNQLYDPKGQVACNPPPAGIDPRRCLPLWGSFGGGDQVQDVLQYYLGAYLPVANDGHAGGTAFGSTGVDDPFTGLSWGLNDPVFAGNNFRRSSFLTTSGVLPTDQFKQFDSWPAARYAKPGGPFDPHTGTQYVYSQIADVSYKRLTREVAVPAAGGSMTFWTSYDTEADWDHLFVEARTPGGNDWTTLPDANGNTTQATGESCKQENSGGWRTLHPITTRPRPALRRVPPPAPPARGTRRAATRGVGRSGASTSRRTPARPSRSPSPTPATGRPRASESSWTTSRSPTAPARRSRPAWTAGRSPDRLRAPLPTSTTSSGPTPRASRSATRSPRRTRCCWGSDWRASRLQPNATQ
jgi:hypothetical protein